MKLLLSKLIAFGMTWPHCWQVQYLCTPTNIKILLLRVSFHIQKQGLYSPVNIVIYNTVAMMSQPCD